MRRVLITGTSSGIGFETALYFLARGWEVEGIDIRDSKITLDGYAHHKVDVRDIDNLPNIEPVDVIVNNAGTINEDEAISTNIEGYVNIIEMYYHEKVKSVVNVASISGHVGLDTARYAASQGARLAYTKHLSMVLGKNGTLVNSISPGAVLSGLEPELYANRDLLAAVANENILKKWIMPEEIAEWIYFVAVVNRSMTGQDILIDNGEVANYNFIHV